MQFAWTLAVALLIGLIAAGPAQAFSGHDHKRLTRQALEALPKPSQKLLKKFKDFIIHETPAPDFKRTKSERPKHIWHPGIDWGTNPKEVAKLTDQLVTALRPILKGEKELTKTTARKIAYLMHYVQDLHQPLHTSQKDRQETEYHDQYEKAYHDLDDVKVFLPDRTRMLLIKDVKKWQEENGKWALQFYNAISADWKDDKKFNRPASFMIYRRAITRARHSCIQILLTILHRASQPAPRKK